MNKSNSTLFLVIVIAFVLSYSNTYKKSAEPSESNYYTQNTHNRTAAEWEPALGTTIVWPLGIPYKLVIELANDNHLYTMVENEDSQQEAEQWFQKWGIDLKNVTFIYADQDFDAWWTRDWGPSAVFTPKKEYMLADGKYIYSTPLTDMSCNDSLRFLFFDENNKMILSQTEDDATIPLAKQLNYKLLDLPFNNTGGNVLTDGLGSAFSTCVIKAENKYHGVSNERLLKLNDSLLGFRNYNIISNFENYGIQHIDCFLKIIDEETMLVAEPPKDHELYDKYEDIVTNELSKLRTAYNNPYKILRLKTARYRGEQLAAYTNSLILNETVYVPLFDIDQDDEALKTWSDAMPGYTIKGFTFHLDDEPLVSKELRRHYRNYGWNDGDALHCRTRAIWNPEMLFISVKKVKTHIDKNKKHTVYATIIDYSDKGLVTEKCKLFWRLKGSQKWNKMPLSTTKNDTHFFAEIPRQKSGDTIEYYISAESKSGEKETRPKTAPEGTFQFSIK